MALSSDQRKRILELLDKLDAEEIHKVLQSQRAFVNWLKENVYDVYVLIANKT